MNTAESRVGLLLEGRYRIEAPLGRGGMGAVYRAVDIRLERPVAVKFLAPRLRGDAGAETRFSREARALASLRHPHIVTVHVVGQSDDVPYFVLELVPGQDLAALLAAHGPLEWTLAAEIGRQVCGGLQHLHEKGYVHRDIKPSNLMLTPEGQVVILDFGVLRDLDAGSTETGLGIGTAAYMAPEQASDPKGVEPRSDLYALGATLFELLTGARPFGGTSSVEVLMRHRTDPIPSPRRRGAELPPALDAIVTRALAKDPRERFDDARAMGAALSALLPSLSSTSGAAAVSAWRTRRRGARSRIRRAVPFVASALLGGALVGAVLWTTRSSLPPAPGSAASTSSTGHETPTPAASREPTPARGADDGGETAARGLIRRDDARETGARAPSASRSTTLPATERAVAPPPPAEPAEVDGTDRTEGAPFAAKGKAPALTAAAPIEGRAGAAAESPARARAIRPASSPRGSVLPPVEARPAAPPAGAAAAERFGVIQVVAHHEGHATWASFEIDGALAEEAAVQVRRAVAPGAHRVRAWRPGYRTATASVTVKAGGFEKVRLSLEKEDTP